MIQAETPGGFQGQDRVQSRAVGRNDAGIRPDGGLSRRAQRCGSGGVGVHWCPGCLLPRRRERKPAAARGSAPRDHVVRVGSARPEQGVSAQDGGGGHGHLGAPGAVRHTACTQINTHTRTHEAHTRYRTSQQLHAHHTGSTAGPSRRR